MAAHPAPLPPLEVVEEGPPGIDTGAAERAEVAALVARARIDGVTSARTAHPRAARRAAGVIDAIVAAAAADVDGPG